MTANLSRASLLAASAAALTALALAPAGAQAAITTFGSPLSVPATLNTSENLNYAGTNTPVPPNPEAPNGIFHTYHNGADTALWNTVLASGAPAAPETGQALEVMLEGCAQPARGGPSPLNQIHFQDITPLPGGGAKVNLTSQPFEIPICGQDGANGSTVSSYEPVNLCVSKGDYVDFNDEGGYVENIYRNGVPYEVIGATMGSKMDSFIRGGGTNNGATLSSDYRTAMEGFAANANEELMLQVKLGTGPDATHICAGGTGGLPPPLPPLHLRPQRSAISNQRFVSFAIYCRLMPRCVGTATVAYGKLLAGRTNFSVRGGTTSHVTMRLSRTFARLVGRRGPLGTTLTALVEGKSYAARFVVQHF